MNQSERRSYLINALLYEQNQTNYSVPENPEEQKRLLRALFNIRMPKEASEKFIQIQDEYLREETESKGITAIEDLKPVQEGIYLWQGDITTLRCDAIVNAANSQMLGCFVPNHTCIDNCIHTFAGIQLRNKCSEIMNKQGFEEPTGRAKLTPAYNLPCKYVIHTVGPVVQGFLTAEDCKMLKSCYNSCLSAACESNLKSIAFCCISTGVFGFPQNEAARTAVETVKDFKASVDYDIKVIFNVFKDEDLKLYHDLLIKK